MTKSKYKTKNEVPVHRKFLASPRLQGQLADFVVPANKHMLICRVIPLQFDIIANNPSILRYIQISKFKIEMKMGWYWNFGIENFQIGLWNIRIHIPIPWDHFPQTPNKMYFCQSWAIFGTAPLIASPFLPVIRGLLILDRQML